MPQRDAANGNSRKLYVGYPCSSPAGAFSAWLGLTTPITPLRIMAWSYYGNSVLQLLHTSDET
ncbi:uncharacterized protein CLUP02_10158 [Colletotrichum lupini]|uniref:Uncharacterized protein n=1 Tax=Colletotrichum lupini TaxID=145971 RepID=A0A9Q8SXX4_9PEZI|nr:uncharacterized protein CLUP02_10158 [Colletotrichum lupini]UQC84662.1 hypothetical protein CLUP02_10158 [Colletotrichum lupini]